jgi:hypothetical protein
MWTKGIWAGIPWDQIKAGEREGGVFFDDFKNMPNLTETDADLHKYAVYQDTGGTNTLGQDPDDEHGALKIVLSGTANEEAWIQAGGNLGPAYNFIIPSVAVPHTIAFEARIKKSAIATGGMFVGMGEPGMAVANTIADGGTIVDKDYIGFFVPEADADGLDFVYNKASGANPTINNADVHTVVADTYVKVGWLYHYKNPAAKQIKVFVNGVIQSDFVTRTEIADTTNFPGGEEMNVLFGGKVGSTDTAHTMTMEWWKAALVVNA